MPAKLILMRGIPGSGKSTKAKELLESGKADVRLNRDLLREMVHFGHWSKANEKVIISTETELARFYLNLDKTVIIDDTNIPYNTVMMWKQVADELKAEWEVVYCLCDVETAIERDLNRERTVGEDVVRKFHNLLMHEVYPNRNDYENHVPRGTES